MLKGKEMGVHDILEIHPPVEILIRLNVIVVLRLPRLLAIVFFREENQNVRGLRGLERRAA